MCIERARIEETTDRLRIELHEPARAAGSPSNLIELPIPSHERAIRTALFSAEIDLAFHRARCIDCRSVVESETLLAA
jgi:hypothetical protein